MRRRRSCNMGCDTHPFREYAKARADAMDKILEFVRDNQPVSISKILQKADINRVYLARDFEDVEIIEDLIRNKELFYFDCRLITFSPSELEKQG